MVENKRDRLLFGGLCSFRSYPIVLFEACYNRIITRRPFNWKEAPSKESMGRCLGQQVANVRDRKTCVRPGVIATGRMGVRVTAPGQRKRSI